MDKQIKLGIVPVTEEHLNEALRLRNISNRPSYTTRCLIAVALAMHNEVEIGSIGCGATSISYENNDTEKCMRFPNSPNLVYMYDTDKFDELRQILPTIFEVYELTPEPEELELLEIF